MPRAASSIRSGRTSTPGSSRSRPPLFLPGENRRHPLPLCQRPDQRPDAARLRRPQHHQHPCHLYRRPRPDDPHQPPAHPVRRHPLPRDDLRGQTDQRLHVPPLEKGPGRAGPALQQGGGKRLGRRGGQGLLPGRRGNRILPRASARNTWRATWRWPGCAAS